MKPFAFKLLVGAALQMLFGIAYVATAQQPPQSAVALGYACFSPASGKEPDCQAAWAKLAETLKSKNIALPPMVIYDTQAKSIVVNGKTQAATTRWAKPYFTIKMDQTPEALGEILLALDTFRKDLEALGCQDIGVGINLSGHP